MNRASWAAVFLALLIMAGSLLGLYLILLAPIQNQQVRDPQRTVGLVNTPGGASTPAIGTAGGTATLIVEGDELFAQSKINEAIAKYERATTINPKEAKAYAHWARALAVRGTKIELAVQKAQQAVDIEPNNALYLAILGWTQDFLGDYNAAVTNTEQAIKLDPKSSAAHAYYAESLADKDIKQLEAAIAAAKKAVELDPNNADAYRAHGYTLQRAGRFDEALEMYTKAVQLMPNASYHRRQLGAFLRDRGRYDQAVAEFNKAIQLEPDNPVGYNSLGRVYYQQDQMAQAAEHFKKATDTDPAYATGWAWRGYTEYRQSNYADAIPYFQKTLELRPRQLDVLVILGQCFLQLKRYPEARDAFNKALAIDPNNEDAKRGLAATEGRL